MLGDLRPELAHAVAGSRVFHMLVWPARDSMDVSLAVLNFQMDRPSFGTCTQMK